jgi:transposase
MYLLGTGCQWRAIPKDLPPRSTVHDYFDRWSRDGTVERMHHALYIACRELDGREASPTAAVIDSQSVKSAEKGAHIDPIGYDAGKKIKGIKRHILTDSTDFLLHAIVHAADIQDRDGGAMLMATLFGLFPFLTMQSIMSEVNIEIVKRSDHAKGFVLLPKRWVVERTLAWLNRCRRLAKHRECRARKARAFLLLVSIRLVVRRLGRG